MSARTALLVALAMIAFAANSLLNRLALAPEPPLTDAASFALVRVLAAATTLSAILALRRGARGPAQRDWRMPAALFVYITGFSFAYLSLSAGTGALILFGAVQITMFAAALSGGERFSLLGWAGLVCAFGGLVYLAAPGVTAPDPMGTALMIAAGVAWGAYSLLGRGVADPLAATAWNFAVCIPLSLLVSAVFWASASASPAGLALAIASGAAASGLGYVLWFAALPQLSAGRAAAVQLSAPIIAALGGAALLSEPLTARLLIASAVTLGGVALVLAQRRT